MSVFLEERKRPKLSFLFYEVFSDHENRDTNPRQAIAHSYRFVYNKKPSKELLASIIKRFESELEDSKTQNQSGRGPGKDSFGSKMAEWMSALDPVGNCLYLADHDIDKARHYYCNEDYKVVTDAAVKKAEYDWQKHFISYEAVLFGTGGKYDGTASGDTRTFDVSNGEIDVMALRASGLGTLH